MALTNEKVADNALRQWIDNFAGQTPPHPVWLLLTELLKRRADEPSAVEYVQDIHLHERLSDCEEAGCIAVIRALNRPCSGGG